MQMKSANFGRLDTNSSQSNQAAIVFVHGFTGDWKGTWGRIPEFLSKDRTLNGWDLFGFGYESRRRFDLLGIWSADAALPEIATKLYTTLDSEVSPNKYKAIALVAHSMGGLVVQEALVRYPDLRLRTNTLVLFGTPSAGLAKADKLSFIKQQIENMREDSDFIKNLRTHWSQLALDSDPRMRFITVAGELDQFVPPASSLGPFVTTAQRVVPGNHVTMLNVTSADDPTVKVLIGALTGGAASAGPQNAERVAIEIGEFAQLVDRLWPSGKPMPTALDDVGVIDLAIALERVGRRSDAVDVLAAHKPQGTDVQGVLGGRLKRRWLATRSEADYQSAVNLYQQAYAISTAEASFNPDQAYYHGINLAFRVSSRIELWRCHPEGPPTCNGRSQLLRESIGSPTRPMDLRHQRGRACHFG
jgi:pimeloyl-ACP methyl ester carboxylesterase